MLQARGEARPLVARAGVARRILVRQGCATSADAHAAPRQGLASPGGYYTAQQPVGNVVYTFWFQFCANMAITRADLGRPGVACSRKGFENNCPKKCRDARTHVCGNGCSGILARAPAERFFCAANPVARSRAPPPPQGQQLPGRKHASCWSVGQWGDGRSVSISLLDPSDPAQGIVYTMLQGDTKGCPGSVARSLSVGIRCPGVGMPVVPVLNVSSLGNCAYAAMMAHPAACPVAASAASRRGKDGRLQPASGGGAYPGYVGAQGSTAGTLGTVVVSALGALGLYCVLGVAWRALVLGARPEDGLLPHGAFWAELPANCMAAAASAADELRGMLEGSSVGVPEEARDEPRMPLLGRRDGGL
jgi:hypothetical protein